MSFTKLDYCQYLLSSQTNYTLTNLAEHLQVFSHDTINRYLRGEKLTPRLLWDNVEHLIQVDEDGSIIFDDTVIDKNFPSDKKVKLFRVTVSTDRTDYIVTNGLSQNPTDEVQEVNAVRWKVEELPFGKASPTSRS